ncbi:MAG: PAS domain S-box protein [Firmicutes bacterium]|nr:PAS domain S-box protein [Bacillota bacterium]
MTRHDLLSTMFDIAGSLMIVMDCTGRIIRFNRAAEQVTGFSEQEVMEQSFFELFLVPRERVPALNAFVRVVAGTSETHRHSLLTKSGTLRMISWATSSVLGDHGEPEYIIAAGIDITEQMQTEERFQSLVDTMPFMLCIFREWTFLYANDAMATLLAAKSPSELVGRDILRFIHPEAHERTRELVLSMNHSHRTLPQFQTQMVRVDGTVIDVEVQSAPISYLGKSAIVAVVRDITDQKRTEMALRESEDRYRQLIAIIPEGVYVHRDGIILFYNRKAQELMGAYDTEELIGRHPWAFLPESFQEQAKARLEELQSGRSELATYELPVIRLDGRLFEGEFTASAISVDGLPAVLTVFRDVSERKKKEEVLMESHGRLQRLSLRDGLTDIGNRRAFDLALDHAWSEALRTQGTLGLVMFDIDRFKQYNDLLGHLQGDDCLRQVAEVVAALVEQDYETATFARFGGEEFAVILPGKSLAETIALAEQIQSRLAKARMEHPASSQGFVTVSLGVAAGSPQPGQYPGRLVSTADQALYRAKQAGRNCIRA